MEQELNKKALIFQRLAEEPNQTRQLNIVFQELNTSGVDTFLNLNKNGEIITIMIQQ